MIKRLFFLFLVMIITSNANLVLVSASNISYSYSGSIESKKVWITTKRNHRRIWIPPEYKAVWVQSQERLLKDGGFVPGYYKAIIVRPGYYR